MLPKIDDALAFSPTCFDCKHLKSNSSRRCAAFGDREIPREIWQGRNPHIDPYPGDRGIQYERIEERGNG